MARRIKKLLNLAQCDGVASVAQPRESLSWMEHLKEALGCKNQTAIIQQELDRQIIKRYLDNEMETQVHIDPRMLSLLESFKRVQAHVQSKAQSLVSMISKFDGSGHDLQDSYEQLLLGAIDTAVEIDNNMQSLMEKVQLAVAFQIRKRKQQDGDIPTPRSATSSQSGTCPRGLHPQDTSRVRGLRVNRHRGRVRYTRGTSGHFDTSHGQTTPSSSRQRESTDSMLCNGQIHVPDRQQADLLCQHRCSGHDYSPPCFVNICCSEDVSLVNTTPPSWGHAALNIPIELG